MNRYNQLFDPFVFGSSAANIAISVYTLRFMQNPTPLCPSSNIYSKVGAPRGELQVKSTTSAEFGFCILYRRVFFEVFTTRAGNTSHLSSLDILYPLPLSESKIRQLQRAISTYNSIHAKQSIPQTHCCHSNEQQQRQQQLIKQINQFAVAQTLSLCFSNHSTQLKQHRPLYI